MRAFLIFFVIEVTCHSVMATGVKDDENDPSVLLSFKAQEVR